MGKREGKRKKKKKECIPEISNIRNRVLVPHKILSPLQSNIQHAIQPFRLAHISLRRIRNPLFRQTIKVVSLSLHGAQTTMLPGHPLLHQRQLRVIFEREFKLGIKVSCQIGQNGSTFHDAQAVLVVVDEDGDAAVGAFVGEPLLFLDVLHDVDALEDVVGFAVGCFEFFEEDACFVACVARLGNDERFFVVLCLCRLQGKLTIGCAECQQLEAAFGNQSIGSVRHGVEVLLWDGCGREGGR